MKILGIIPARAGSKGVPGKNTRNLARFPLLAYTAFAAQKASLLQKIILSSDDPVSIKLAKQYQLEVPFIRPAILATDNASSIKVIQHAIRFYEDQGILYDAVCLLQPTYPFRVPGMIDHCIKTFIDTGADSLFTVVPVPSAYNPHWVFEKGNDGWLKSATGDQSLVSSRQLLPDAFCRDGAIYVCKTDLLMQESTLFNERTGFVENDLKWYVNIDTTEDWEKAENMAEDYLEQFSIEINSDASKEL